MPKYCVRTYNLCTTCIINIVCNSQINTLILYINVQFNLCKVYSTQNVCHFNDLFNFPPVCVI